MARIRTIKPEFFQHEGLQDLELRHAGKYPMFVFEGLWCHCDKHGVFEWRPRILKLNILPFLAFDMAEVLEILANAKYIVKGTDGDREYGFIPTFKKHQRINGKEAADTAKYPLCNEWEVIGQQWGRDGEATEITGREGKGKEREVEGVRGNNGVSGKPKAPSLTDEEWLESLKSNPAYKNHDITTLYHKMLEWCKLPRNKGKKPSRARFLNWLNREETPMSSAVPDDKREKMKEALKQAYRRKKAQEEYREFRPDMFELGTYNTILSSIEKLERRLQ